MIYIIASAIAAFFGAVVYDTYFADYHYVKDSAKRQLYFTILNTRLQTKKELDVEVNLLYAKKRMFSRCIYYGLEVYFQNKYMEIEFSSETTDLVFRKDYIKYSEKEKGAFNDLMFALKLFS